MTDIVLTTVVVELKGLILHNSPLPTCTIHTVSSILRERETRKTIECLRDFYNTISLTLNDDAMVRTILSEVLS